MTTLRNLTPHAITLIDADGSQFTVQPEPVSARCEPRDTPMGLECILGEGTTHMIPLVSPGYGAVTGLPGEETGVLLFVSRVIMDACPTRHDLVTSASLVRDADGRIVGCGALAIQD